VAFTPDGRHLVTRGDDRSVRIWNVAARRQAAQLAHDAAVTAFALSPDGSTVATAAGTETLLWATTATGEPRARMKQSSAVVGVAFRPDGQALATLANDGTERLSDLSGRVLWESRHPGNPSAIAFDPSGEYVVMASDDAVTLSDAGTGKERARLRHDATITGMATSRDGAFVATTANDETTRIWSAADGHEVIRFATAGASTLLGFDPSGEHLLVATEGGVANLLWRTRDLVAVACAHLRRGLTADERRHFLLASTAAQSCPSEP